MRLTNNMRDITRSNIRAMFRDARNNLKPPEGLYQYFPPSALKQFARPEGIHPIFLHHSANTLTARITGYGEFSFRVPDGEYYPDEERLTEFDVQLDEIAEPARGFLKTRLELKQAELSLLNAANEALQYTTREKALTALPELERFLPS